MGEPSIVKQCVITIKHWTECSITSEMSAQISQRTRYLKAWCLSVYVLVFWMYFSFDD